jgi:site-specific DNA-methyltransferase (adenine-specific)
MTLDVTRLAGPAPLQLAIEPVSLIPAMPGLVHRRGWLPPEELSWEDWLLIGEGLQQAEESLMWLLGDWWRFGERKWPQTCHQGLRDAVKDLTGYSLQTVKNAASVCAAFPSPESRIPNVSFSFHEAVAALPAPERAPTIEVAVEEGWNREQLREAVRERKAEIRAEAYAARPLPAWQPEQLTLHCADARALPIADGVVDLIVTSPPYALDKRYLGGDVAAASWRHFIGEFAEEAFRVLAPGGRLALNVPLDTTLGGFRPTYAQAVAAAQKAGFTYRTTVVWHDTQLGKSTARGSQDSAAAPHIIAPVETIVLLSKGAWGREEPWDRPSDLAHTDWLEWTNGFWTFPGESSPWEDQPAAFPLELPRRLIYLLSFPGDLVLDPFLGSGTTAVAGLRAGRRVVGCDVEQRYLDATLRRVAKEG